MVPRMNPMKQVLVTNYFNYDRKTGEPVKRGERLAVLRPFVFLHLPLEIREKIYRCAVVDTRPQRIAISPTYGLGLENADEYDCYISLDGRPVIARTCRLIRNEVLPIYYSQNNFVALVENFDLEHFHYWTRHVDRKYLAMIPNVKIILFGQNGVCDVDELAEQCLSVFQPGVVTVGGQPNMVPIFEAFLAITAKIISATDGDCEKRIMLSQLATIRSHYKMQMRKVCHCELPYDAIDFTTWLLKEIKARVLAGEIVLREFGHDNDDYCFHHRSCGCCGAHIPSLLTIAQYMCDQDELDDICYQMGWEEDVSDIDEFSADGYEQCSEDSGSEDGMRGVTLPP